MLNEIQSCFSLYLFHVHHELLLHLLSIYSFYITFFVSISPGIRREKKLHMEKEIINEIEKIAMCSEEFTARFMKSVIRT